jgi:hypothetical protein
VISVALALALAAAAFLGGVLVGLALGGGRARRVADRLLPHVDPYLRRKAAEAGLSVTHPTFSARTPPDEIAAHVGQLAERLLERERRGQPPGTTDSLGLAATQPVDSGAVDREGV